MSWVRYRFKTKARDHRPLLFDRRFPWWCSGYGDDYATIVAYLPKNVDLRKYWDDAFDIDEEDVDAIVFSDRFPRPDWFMDETSAATAPAMCKRCGRILSAGELEDGVCVRSDQCRTRRRKGTIR